MNSARTKWGGAKTVAAVNAPASTMPFAAPSDAFAAMMQAAAAPEQVPAHGRGGSLGAQAASSGRGSGGSSGGKGSGGRGRGGRGGGRGGQRRSGGEVQPFKRIEGTPFVVDGFTCGVNPADIYFLTHFHADHYGGITKRWSAPIYASQITAALCVRRLGIRAEQMAALPMDTPTEIHGARVTLMDANHCPGAVLLLFELSNGRSVLHTGDFRYEPSMLLHPALQRSQAAGLDALYLDTTYCDPKYCFPTQAAVVQAVVDRCRLLLDAPRTLVLFGSYSIGKERVFLEVGRQCGVHIHVERQKARLIECMQLPPEDARLLTSDVNATRWRVVPMAHLKAQRLRELLRSSGGRFTGCVAFRPTGWAYGRGSGTSGGAAGRLIRLSEGVSIVEVPYSEHSSFEELRSCVQSLRPRRIVSTVGGGPLGDRHAGVASLTS